LTEYCGKRSRVRRLTHSAPEEGLSVEYAGVLDAVDDEV
jgi:hypothetical protein